MSAQLIKDLSMKDYQEYPALSKSMLSELISDTPWHMWNKYLNEDNKPRFIPQIPRPYYEFWKVNKKEHFDVGSAVHCYLLEPDNMDKYVAVRPDGDLRSNQAKDDMDLFLRENDGKAIITEQDMSMVKMAAANVLKKNASKILLNKSGFVESTIIWNRNGDGTKMKCRPDFVNPDMDIVVDVKTARSANKNQFQRDAYWNYKYHLSHAITAEGYESYFKRPLQAYIYLVIEKDTNQVAFYNSENDLLFKGQELMEEYIPIYDKCLEAGVWDSYPDEIQPINIPGGN